jgi:hypothetical protein
VLTAPLLSGQPASGEFCPLVGEGLMAQPLLGTDCVMVIAKYGLQAFGGLRRPSRRFADDG